jgi:16S rRNA (uracil1498-N3)-methyltransferase
VVDGGRASGVATFFCDGPLEASRTAEIGADEAHHARVRRLETGARVRLIDGAGAVAAGALAKLATSGATIDVEEVAHVSPLPPIHLLAPIADRAVMWRRSRGVSPRGEGAGFHAKLRARMISALTQSGGAWLPALLPDASGEDVIDTAGPGARFLLDGAGEPILTLPLTAPLTIAVGPEGGLDDDERRRLAIAGWMPVSLGGTTLRFETAGTAALAIARAAFAANVESARG